MFPFSFEKDEIKNSICIHLNGERVEAVTLFCKESCTFNQSHNLRMNALSNTHYIGLRVNCEYNKKSSAFFMFCLLKHNFICVLFCVSLKLGNYLTF